ncbi:MAG: POTRA domain-containing protein [Sphingobacteriales bacterium]
MRVTLLILFFCCFFFRMEAKAQDKYAVTYRFLDKDTLHTAESLGLKRGFSSRTECISYMNSVVDQQKMKGFITFSVDSVHYDSLRAEAWVFAGARYIWKNIRVPGNEASLFSALGYQEKLFNGKAVDLNKLQQFQERMLGYMDNHGYPFAKFQLDSLVMDGGEVSGVWAVEKGPHYKIDSITVTGTAKISKYYLQQYLEIPNGSYYREDKLEAISRRIMELPFLKESRPWNMTMVGTGSVVNLYLDTRRSSQVNAIVGFLPANQTLGGKMLITGEANLNLKNAFGAGETLGLNWQQLQIQSPRLNVVFQQPYMFRSRFGFDFNFDLFKKDSSFLNINLILGLQYMVSQRQQGKLFFQSFRTNLITVDTNAIKSTKALPQFLDVSTQNLGLDYSFNNTDYRLNPRKGNEWYIVVSGGLRKIRENNTILGLTTDATGKPYDFSKLYDTLKLRTYMFRMKLAGAHYFRTGKQSTIRTAISGGWLQTENPFRNELFQIGGYKLLRGFDEESIYASQYAVGTVEYRYLIGVNAYLFAFADGGWARDKSFGTAISHTYFGTGFGLALETKAGILNLSYAVGKRDDQNFSLRQSKIHFGFVSIF